MKTIYVTVAEFLENGGRLEAKRPVYNTKQPAIGWVSPKNYDSDRPDMTVVANNSSSMYCYNDLIYVEIPCTPIYK